jgi:hypothetical protein
MGSAIGVLPIIPEGKKMGTRMYCDHCGLTTSKLNKFVYGDHRNTYNYGQMQYPLLGGVVNYPMIAVTPPLTPLEAIDLCDKCWPVWMKRVEKLTMPEEGEDKEKA